MGCDCVYAKLSNNIGREAGYLCRNEKRKKNINSDLCCATDTYWTGHARLDIENDFDKMNSCEYKKTELTPEEKIKFDKEDGEEEIKRLEEKFKKMTPKDWERLKMESYSDY